MTPLEIAIVKRKLSALRNFVMTQYGECWIWALGKDEKGYGRLVITDEGRRRQRHVHVLSYELNIGPTNGLHVLHKCDVPACLNPDHLLLGNDKDNQVDMVRKGRWSYNSAKLTPEEVATIRERIAKGDRKTQIAIDYGVHYTSIRDIANGRYWRD